MISSVAKSSPGIKFCPAFSKAGRRRQGGASPLPGVGQGGEPVPRPDAGAHVKGWGNYICTLRSMGRELSAAYSAMEASYIRVSLFPIRA